MSTSTASYEIDTVASADGTEIGYRSLGNGPGVILLGGGYTAAQHYMGLAESLSGSFTVCAPDRRGRGLSGPQGDRYSIATECEDVDALLRAAPAAGLPARRL